MIRVNDARASVLQNIEPLDSIEIPAIEALSRHLAEDIISDRPLPPFDRVAMDGFAVRSEDFKQPETRLKIIGEARAGISPDFEVRSGETAKIMTGAPLIKGADAVVKVEKSTIEGDSVLLKEENMRPGLNIAPEGEDAKAGEVLLPAGTLLSSAGLAVCASVGRVKVKVTPKPSIRIITTGTEIISPDKHPLPHQIRDCNSHSVLASCLNLQANAEFMGIADDDRDSLALAIQKGLTADILILTGGVSMGEYDFIPETLAKLGVKKIFHKVRLKPGKPVWYGRTEAGTHVFGLPGNPVSVQVNFKLFVEPLIQKLGGDPNPEPQSFFLPLAQSIHKKNDREEYFPARIVRTSDNTTLEPVSIRGSGDFSNLAKSDGLIRCHVETKIMNAGEKVEFLLWKRI